jgi:hypothetical protein
MKKVDLASASGFSGGAFKTYGEMIAMYHHFQSKLIEGVHAHIETGYELS